MRTAIGSFLLFPLSGGGAAHADRLHLSAWLCDHGLARHAHGVARAPSAYLLLAHLHSRGAPRAEPRGGGARGAARRYHCVALWASAQSRGWERPSNRALVGAGSPGHLART